MKARSKERRSRQKVLAVKPLGWQIPNNVQVTKRRASNQTSFLFYGAEKVALDVCYAAFHFHI